MNTPEVWRARLVEQLVSAGTLRSRPWIDAFSEVPRHAFLRRFFRQSSDLTGWLAVSDADPGGYELIYSDASWVTQLDHDPSRWQSAYNAGKPVAGIPTSSSTAPGLMALMLEALTIDPGDRVLEIGAGSGYNAALLCHRLEPSLVFSVEVDPVVAQVATEALSAIGYRPAVVVGDGVAGHPPGAPYDRLIGTCSCSLIPPAWLRQVRPGGLALASIFRDLGGGALVRLRVDRHGGAEGQFLADFASFMPDRARLPADVSARLADALSTAAGGESRAAEAPFDIVDSLDFGMVAALRLPGVASIGFIPDTGPQRWLLADDGSWACGDETTGTVTQHGRRLLWDEVEELYEQWVRRGSPGRDRLGLTVTDTGEHRFWQDDPGAVWWSESGRSPE